MHYGIPKIENCVKLKRSMQNEWFSVWKSVKLIETKNHKTVRPYGNSKKVPEEKGTISPPPSYQLGLTFKSFRGEGEI